MRPFLLLRLFCALCFALSSQALADREPSQALPDDGAPALAGVPLFGPVWLDEKHDGTRVQAGREAQQIYVMASEVAAFTPVSPRRPWVCFQGPYERGGDCHAAADSAILLQMRFVCRAERPRHCAFSDATYVYQGALDAFRGRLARARDG